LCVIQNNNRVGVSTQDKAELEYAGGRSTKNRGRGTKRRAEEKGEGGGDSKAPEIRLLEYMGNAWGKTEIGREDEASPI